MLKLMAVGSWCEGGVAWGEWAEAAGTLASNLRESRSVHVEVELPWGRKWNESAGW